MTLNLILERTKDYETMPAGSTEEWFLATDALKSRSIEELDISSNTGALVVATRNGYWNDAGTEQDIELLLRGTPSQLAAAQEQFKLLPYVDALLDRPEIYWG